MNRFEIREQFYLDGVPFKIISGAIHYFRVHPAYWRDRLEKLRAMGCNCVETYVPWNLHEPAAGKFHFEGGLDLAAFLRTAQEVGLYAIVRPSPYICAEWEFGGLPAWLLAGEDMPLRSSEGPFLSHVARYYKRLFQELAPMQIDRGGPVLLMQVENEFGVWGREDPAYLEGLAGLMRENGATVPFITADNLDEYALDRGSMDGALATVNFGSGAAEKLEVLRPHAKGGPLMVTEFWVGWFDAWGDVHHTAGAEENAADLDEILRRGSVNFYMFHGGTNPGLYNGSNYFDHLTPDVTSYDYDAPLTEDGRETEKYRAFQRIIGKYASIPRVELTTEIVRRGYGTLEAVGRVGLFDALDSLGQPAVLDTPKSMERLGQSCGYILYRATLPAGTRATSLELVDAADRALIFLDGVPVLTLMDRELKGPRSGDWALEQDTRLDILVENLGRVNYGPQMTRQRKGIDGPVLLDGVPVTPWQAWTLPMEGLEGLKFSAKAEGPAFYRFTFHAGERGDTFLDTTGWGKGCALLNGVNIGRFWDIGPQRRLYIPGPMLKEGENELILFESEGRAPGTVALAEEPDLG